LGNHPKLGDDKYDYISYQHDNNDKYKVCIQAKMTKKPFSKVERNSQLLG
jgi:hypothetical protein